MTRPRQRLYTLCLAGTLLLAQGCRTKGGEAFNEGQALLKKGHSAHAIKRFEAAVSANPEFGEAYYNLGAARYQEAVRLLRAVVAKHGGPALKKALAASLPNKGESTAGPDKLTAERRQTAAVLQAELAKLPAADTEPIAALLQGSLEAKLKARQLFQKGKFVVVTKSGERKAMLAKLATVTQLHAALTPKGAPDRGLLLLAVVRPGLVPLPGRSEKK